MVAKKFMLAGLAAALLGGAGLAGLYGYAGAYGVNVLLRRGGTFWTPVAADDPRISSAMRLALASEPPTGSAGPFAWHRAAAGFDVAELPVLANGAEVDRILLARIDPGRYRFVVRNAPAGDEGLHDWMTTLGAAFVINGSYYSRRGTPDTPFLSDGALLGPADYDATQGAFVASSATAGIHDLAHETWQTAFRAADNALVSYPLLLGPNPPDRQIKASRWLANRSFVGQDGAGKIILGTTTNAFFSLARLAAFLRTAPLGLTSALNLDGGPVACQAVSVGSYSRSFCGKWELQEQDGKAQLLTWPYGSWALPVVLAAIPKS